MILSFVYALKKSVLTFKLTLKKFTWEREHDSFRGAVVASVREDCHGNPLVGGSSVPPENFRFHFNIDLELLELSHYIIYYTIH